MAQRVQVQLVDDINGQEAQETIRFGLDGTAYEIDLTTENAEKLRTGLSEFVEKGRKVSGRGNNGGRPSTLTIRNKREDTQQIRKWAQENGHNPSSRGRLNQSIIEAYNEAQK